MTDFTIRVGDSTDVYQNGACVHYTGAVKSGGNLILTCEAVGRYVGFLRDDDARVDKHLTTLCEVVVMGYRVTGKVTIRIIKLLKCQLRLFS